MAKGKGLQTPIILLIIAGIILLCCCPSVVLGVPALLSIFDGLGSQPAEIPIGDYPVDTIDFVDTELDDIEIVTEVEFSEEDSQEFMHDFIADEGFQSLYEWGVVEGYLEVDTPVGGGAEVVYSDGSVLQGVVHGAIQILQISHLEKSSYGYILSRFEGSEEDPVWVLFNRDGYSEISEEGISVYDSNGNSKGSVKFASLAEGLSFSNFSPAAATSCTTKSWDEFIRCLEGQGSKTVLVSLCVASVAVAQTTCVVTGVFTLGGSCIAAISGIAIACGIVPVVCIPPAMFDDPPETALSLWSDTGEKRWVPENSPAGGDGDIVGWIEATVWKAKLTVTDDREPAPSVQPASDWVTAVSGECPALEIKDCGGNKINPQYCAPDLSAEEQNTWTPNDPFEEEQPVVVQPTEKQPEEIIDIPVLISYSGRYTSTMSQESGSTTWTCSRNDDYWFDVVYTYNFNPDNSVTLVGVKQDGVTRTDGPWATYAPNEAGFWEVESSTDTGYWRNRLYFSNTELKLEKLFRKPDGSSGTCTITLQVTETE